VPEVVIAGVAYTPSPRSRCAHSRMALMRPFTIFLLLVLAGASAATAIGCVTPIGSYAVAPLYIHSGPDQPGNLAIAFINRVNIHARRKHYERAFADYKSALELDPSSALIP
jgi:hypothetical protein